MENPVRRCLFLKNQENLERNKPVLCNSIELAIAKKVKGYFQILRK